ncbi:MAG: extracellular solute-binding protein [Ruminococcus sp.]
MKIKRILSLVLAIALMAVVFVGCGESGSDKKDTGNSTSESGDSSIDIEENAKLKVWGPAKSVDLLKKQVKAFQDENKDKNITVEVVPQEENDAATNALNDLDAAADVFGFASDQLVRLEQAKALSPLYKQFSDDVIANHTAAAVDAAKGEVDGTEVLYAFPETDNGYYLVYDKSVVTEEDAKSLEGVLEACKKAGRKFIMDAGNGYYSCMFTFTGGMKLEGLEGEAQDTQKFNDYNEDEVVASMKAFADLFAKYKDTCVFDKVDKVSAGFDLDKRTCGAGIDGTWNASHNQEILGDDYGVAKLPTININGKDTDTIGMIGYKYIGVNSHSKYPNAAMALANYLSGEDCQKQRFDELGWTPTHQSVEVKENATTKVMLEEAKTFVVQANIVGAFWDPMGNLGSQLYKEGAKTDEASLKTLLGKTIANING